MISEAYRELNRQMHKTPDYGTSGRKCADVVSELLKNAESWLDYGCGKETLRGAVAFDGEYTGFDPAIKGKDALCQADVVTCTDVMEHVEPQFVDAVLDDVMAHTSKCAFFTISCAIGSRVLPDGTPAHKSVHPPQWWKAKLARYGTVKVLASIARTPELVCVVTKDTK